MAACIIIFIVISVINYLVITTIVDMVLMGSLHFSFSGKCNQPRMLITRKNRIDLQTGYQCSAYASAFLLRHSGTEASGEDLYREMPNKMESGYVYPKGIQNLLPQHGLCVKYCSGNLNALKNELAKGNPVIVLIRVYPDKNWLHYVPVVGYDENQLFIAESLPELINCEEAYYNRKISNQDFQKLWNTRMLKMPLYTHTYFVVCKNYG